jgi:hypothetical protein
MADCLQRVMSGGRSRQLQSPLSIRERWFKIAHASFRRRLASLYPKCVSPASQAPRSGSLAPAPLASAGLLLPVYLLELGYGPFETGIIATGALAGSALLTLLVVFYAHRATGRSLLIGAAIVMMLSGIAFATLEKSGSSSSPSWAP